MRRFGLHFGLAYQLLDDWLDYRGNSESMGKNVGDDLAEGKLTLPLIYALENADATDQAMVRDAIDSKNVDMLGDVLRIVDQCGALAYTRTCAQRDRDCAALLESNSTTTTNSSMQLSHYSLSRSAKSSYRFDTLTTKMKDAAAPASESASPCKPARILGQI